MADRTKNPALLKGTLDAMVLRVLQEGAEHGFGIARRIEKASSGVLGIEEGSLYPALHRLCQAGAIEGEWRTSGAGRRARYYRLTPKGRRRLATEVKRWNRLSSAVSAVLGTASGPPREAPA